MGVWRECVEQKLSKDAGLKSEKKPRRGMAIEEGQGKECIFDLGIDQKGAQACVVFRLRMHIRVEERRKFLVPE